MAQGVTGMATIPGLMLARTTPTQLVSTAHGVYATAQRMSIAANLLTASGRSMGDVARAVGHESEISFSRAFREWPGMPPGKYRRSGGRVEVT